MRGYGSFCAFAGCRLIFMSFAVFIGEPFWKSLFQHQTPRRELLLIRGADCASPFSCGVCVGGQWSDEWVEDILEERDHGRTIGIVVRESDLEAEDSVGVWAWEIHEASVVEAGRHAHTDNWQYLYARTTLLSRAEVLRALALRTDP
jgi:hypothetical protein